MLHVALYQPEIPPNTGNAIRLCANTGAQLHLIEPLGFAFDDARLRRAGLDYHEFTKVQIHANLADCLRTAAAHRVFAFTRSAKRRFDTVRFEPGDLLLFGPESRGLAEDVLALVPESQHLALPIRPGQRSLNLSNAVAVAVFEAWRQWNFAGAASSDHP